MQDLYKQTNYVTEGIFEPSIELFYKAERELRDYMVQMTQNIEFRYNTDLKETIMQFIEYSKGLDMSGVIISYLNTTMGTERASDFVMKELKEPSNDWVGMFDKGELDSNMMIPFVQLYKLIKKEAELLDKYKTYVSRLEQ